MKKLLLSVMIVAAAITSCSKKTTGTVGENDGRVEIKLNSGVAVSKAELDNTSAITGLAFRRVDQVGNPPVVGLGSAPVLKANRAADGSIAFDVPQYYNADGLIGSWFLSYYPEGTVAGTDVTWDIDGKTDILVSSIFTAGNKTAPVLTPLNYDHTLFMVEILCKAEAGKDTEVQSRWGKVVGVKLKDTPKQRILDVKETGELATMPTYKASAQVATLPLFDKDFGAFQPITISENNIGVQARGMFAPQGNKIQLIVTTQRDGAGEIDTELPVFTVGGGGGDGISAGRKHLLTLTFKPGPGEPEIVLTSTISDWVQGQPGDIPVD